MQDGFSSFLGRRLAILRVAEWWQMILGRWDWYHVKQQSVSLGDECCAWLAKEWGSFASVPVLHRNAHWSFILLDLYWVHTYYHVWNTLSFRKLLCGMQIGKKNISSCNLNLIWLFRFNLTILICSLFSPLLWPVASCCLQHPGGWTEGPFQALPLGTVCWAGCCSSAEPAATGTRLHTSPASPVPMLFLALRCLSCYWNQALHEWP